MADWFKRVSMAAIRDGFASLVWSYLPVWGIPMLGGILLLVKSYPVEHIFAFILVIFAFTVLALNNLSQWMAARTPVGKVNYSVPVIGTIPQKFYDKSSTSDKLQGIRLGENLISAAQFPIDIQLDEIETRIGNRVPSQKTSFATIRVGNGIVAQFVDSMIDLSDMGLESTTLYGHIKTKVSYGHPGKLKYKLEKTTYLAIRFDAGQFVTMETSLNDFQPNITS